VRLRLEEREYVVEEILDQWYGPDDAFFGGRTDHGNLYILRHRPASSGSEWALESFRQL